MLLNKEKNDHYKFNNADTLQARKGPFLKMAKSKTYHYFLS